MSWLLFIGTVFYLCVCVVNSQTAAGNVQGESAIGQDDSLGIKHYEVQQ